MATKSLKLGRAWDDEFNRWTEELMLGRQSKKPKQSPKAKSSWTGTELDTPSPPSYPGKGSKADVTARLFAMAKGGRQVMIKITGGSKNARAMKKHLDYLSREGQLELTDQDGHPINGNDALKEVVWGWENTGPKLDPDADRKEAFNIVFSMPEGTDPRALVDAVRATAGVEFAGHPWVMVQHFDEPQVHAHLNVKAEALDGRRLNPRKTDLQRWRERFAYELRERGVEAEATRRAPRMRQAKINKPWGVTRREERGEETNAKPSTPNPAKAVAWTKSFNETLTTHGKVVDALARSSDAHDQFLAQQLRKMIAAQTKAHIQEPVRKAPVLER